MMHRLFAIVLVLAGLGAMNPQAKAVLPITAPSTQKVSVTALEQAGGPFLNSFNAGSAALIPYSAILTNNTNQPIIVVVADWKYTDAHGFVKHFWLRADSTMAFRIPPLAEPHQSVLLRPDGPVPAAYAHENNGYLAAGLTPRSVAKFSSAKDVSLTIDCIIFANGEYIGPNNER